MRWISETVAVLAMLTGRMLFAAEGVASVSGEQTFGETVTESRLAGWEADELRLRAAYAECVAGVVNPAEGVVVPLQTSSDGRPQVTATAGKAHYFEVPDPAAKDKKRRKRKILVWCQDVTVRMFDEKDGSVSVELRAPGGLFDRETMSGWLDGAVTGHWETAPIAGTGVYFACSKEKTGERQRMGLSYMKISSGVRLAFPLQ